MVNRIAYTYFESGKVTMQLEQDNKQAKLTSTDYLLVLLTRFDICSEERALKIFRSYKRKIYGY